ncbi:MAG: dihydrofolate reductase family protein [Actinoallomurus sp.]
MTTVISGFSTSLDGFIADPGDDVGPLFDWYTCGDIDPHTERHPRELRMTAASVRHWQDLVDRVGAQVCGRRLFDHTRGWGGNPVFDGPVFVVSHRPPPPDWPPRPDAPFTFVTSGVEEAVERAKAAAGEDRFVSVAGPDIARQCLNAGLLDEVWIDLVPVFLGQGIRYFADLTPGFLENPRVIEGDRVTHLKYRVRRQKGQEGPRWA